MTKELLIGSVAWALLLGGCAQPEESEEEEVGTAEQAIVAYQTTFVTSQKKNHHTVSVATTDGPFATPFWRSDVTVAFEIGGKTFRTFSHDDGMSWSTIFGVVPPLFSPPTGSDGNPLTVYEGMPTAVGYHRNQTGSDPYARNFILITKAGTAQNGSTNTGILSSGFSTDVVGLISDDGGEDFLAPTIINLPHPTGDMYEINFVTATPIKDPATDLDGNAVLVYWRERSFDPVLGTDAFHWWRRQIHVSSLIGPDNDTITKDSVQDRLDGIPGSVTEITADGWCVGFATTGAAPNPCPSTSTISQSWAYNCNPLNAVAQETVTSDSAFKKCVGNSSVAGGTNYNPSDGKPALAIDPVTNVAYMAVPKKRTGTTDFQRIDVWMRNAVTGVWSFIGGSPSTAGTMPINASRDSWLPTLAVFHYPGESQGRLALAYTTTIYDLAANDKVRTVGHWWPTSAASVPTVPSFIDSTVNPAYVQTETLGRYHGVASYPHLTEGFQHGFGDQASTWTYVRTSRHVW